MKSRSQKVLASKILGVGKGKVWFDPLRLEDIQQAITRADIMDLVKDKAIKIKPNKRKMPKEFRKRKGAGRTKMKVSHGKEEYINKIRKIRRHLSEAHERKEISAESKKRLRRLAKAGFFRSSRHLKEHLKTVNQSVSK